MRPPGYGRVSPPIADQTLPFFSASKIDLELAKDTGMSAFVGVKHRSLGEMSHPLFP